MGPSELRKMKYEWNTQVKNKINNLPLVQQFALMAVNKCLAAKHVMSQPFLSCVHA